jgi:putative RNA 2'-phosphotransferase
MKKINIKHSQKISHALRHEPEKYNISLDTEGWCSVKILSENLKIPKDQIEFIVTNCDKQRFSIENGKIRANQGHSIKEVVIKHKRIEKDYPETLYHGTKTYNLKSILDKGLESRERQHVHLSPNIESAKKVASRREGNSVILEIKTSRLIEQGLFLSENKVYLTEKVEPKDLSVFEYF